MNKLIYFADDDFHMRRDTKSILEKNSFHVECFENCNLLYDKFLSKNSDLVILNKTTPSSNGFVTSAKIRQLSKLPIIMLTPRELDDDYILGDPLGIDAFITKPLRPAKLITQVKTLLARTELSGIYPRHNEKQAMLTYADIAINTDNLTVHCNDKELKLTNTEFSMLIFMLENQNRAISRNELLSKIWGQNSHVGIRATDDIVKRLRKKLLLAGSSLLIEVVWGYGFKLNTIQ